MNPPLALIQVAPTGTRESLAFVDYSVDPPDPRNGLRMIEQPVYPPAPRGEVLRALRGEGDAWVSLGDAARALGITVVQLSELERGRATLGDADWARAEAVVRELVARGGTEAIRAAIPSRIIGAPVRVAGVDCEEMIWAAVRDAVAEPPAAQWLIWVCGETHARDRRVNVRRVPRAKFADVVEADAEELATLVEDLPAFVASVRRELPEGRILVCVGTMDALGGNINLHERATADARAEFRDGGRDA